MSTAALCHHCDTPLTNPAETWPAGDADIPDAELCQECWEKETSRAWWVINTALDKAGLINWPVEVNPSRPSASSAPLR